MVGIAFYFRKKRNIFPNKGFLKEICDVEDKLLKSKHYDGIIDEKIVNFKEGETDNGQ